MFRNRNVDHTEFRKTFFGVKSRQNFCIELRSRNWIDHINNGVRRRVFAEPMGLKKGWIIYTSIPNRAGFEGLSADQAQQIYDEIVRALHFLGYEVDVAT